jgi:hypothetical protein
MPCEINEVPLVTFAVNLTTSPTRTASSVVPSERVVVVLRLEIVCPDPVDTVIIISKLITAALRVAMPKSLRFAKTPHTFEEGMMRGTQTQPK